MNHEELSFNRKKATAKQKQLVAQAAKEVCDLIYEAADKMNGFNVMVGDTVVLTGTGDEQVNMLLNLFKNLKPEHLSIALEIHNKKNGFSKN